MPGEVFVDTNVLVYARDASEPEKQPQAADWMRRLWENRSGRISYQVLQEFYAAVTRKLNPGMDRAQAREDVQALTAWDPLPLGYRTLEGAWMVQDRYGLAWWDALIVAAARESGCRYLLTEDLQAGQELFGVKVVDPFATSPDHLKMGSS